MWKSSDIKQLINYLKTHPTAARELAKALEQQLPAMEDDNPDGNVIKQQSISHFIRETASEPHVEVCWITAVEMGKRLGQSAKWVKDRLNILPPDSIKQGTKRRWLIDERMVNNLMQYK